MAESKEPTAESVIGRDVLDAIKGLQLALIQRAKDAVEDDGDAKGDIDAKQLLIQLIAAVTGQTGNQQSQQQLSQQVGEIVAALTGRTVTQTTHIADVNGPERMLMAVARGADNNELASQRLNGIAGDVAQLASVGLGVLMTSTSVVAAQIQANIPDHGSKNSDVGRLVMDCCKAGHGECKPNDGK